MDQQTEKSVTNLQRLVLSWDYWQLFDSEGVVGGHGERLHEPPRTFSSEQEYVAAFRPLLLDECAASLLRAGGLDSQQHIATCTLDEHEHDEGFLDVTAQLQDAQSSTFSDNDCVVLSRLHPEDERAGEEAHVLAWVVSRRGDNALRVRINLKAAVPRKGGPDRMQQMQKALAVGDEWDTVRTWHLQQLANLSTLAREWAALHRTGSIPVIRTVLSGKPPALLGGGKARKAVPLGQQAALADRYNDSQRAAINAGLQANARIVLVQGPPGTGKTNTILGLLSVLSCAIPADSPSLLRVSDDATTLANANRAVLKLRASPWLRVGNTRRSMDISAIPLDDGCSIADPLFGLKPAAPPLPVGGSSRRQPRLLVCAPSNGALDEIVIRLHVSGLMDAKGGQWTPNVVRIGLNPHSSIEALSLEHLVKARMALTPSQEGKPSGAKYKREQIQTEILDAADIICSTLSFAGSGVFRQLTRPLDALVIDEAGQAVEPALLIPMSLGINQVFLVGDPKQLPATVLSQPSLACLYGRSMFERLQSAGHPVQVLDTQYRMHPVICGFTSRQFYGGAVTDAPGMAEKTEQPYHVSPCFGPFAFFDVQGKEMMSGSSLVNRVEAEMVLILVARLTTAYPRLLQESAIGIISPYKAQVQLLRQKLKDALGDRAQMIDINTIDGFQGREKELCIFTTVRSSRRGGIGFVADERRINVGLSRARSSLLVVGNARQLKKDAKWAGVVSYADSIGCLFKAEKPFQSYIASLEAQADGGIEADAALAAAEQHFSREPEAGDYDDEDAYSDYDQMPATMESSGAAAAPVAHSAIQAAAAAAAKNKGRGRGGGAKRKAG